MNIDRKYTIHATNPVSGKTYSEKNAVLFCAKDQAFLEILPMYLEACRYRGSNQEHLDSIKLLIGRVKKFQETESKVPDTLGGEIERCLHGVGVNDKPKVEVYSDPKCIFKYCPHPDVCQSGSGECCSPRG